MNTKEVVNAFYDDCCSQNRKLSTGEYLKSQFVGLPKPLEKKRIKILKNTLKKAKMLTKEKLEFLLNESSKNSKFSILKYMSFGIGTLLAVEGLALTGLLEVVQFAKTDSEVLTYYKTLFDLWKVVTIPFVGLLWLVLYYIKMIKTEKYTFINAYLNKVLLQL